MDRMTRLAALAVLAGLLTYSWGAAAQTTTTSSSSSSSSTEDCTDCTEEDQTEAAFSGEDPVNGPTACGAIMCLWGLMQGQNGGEGCKDQSAGFFKIKVKHHGAYDPARTAAKRAKYLAEKCKVPETQPKQPAIISVYGPKKKSPF